MTNETSSNLKVRALHWGEHKALNQGVKLIATDCFGNEFARLDLTLQTTTAEIEAFKAEKQARYERRILSAIEPQPAVSGEADGRDLRDADAPMECDYDKITAAENVLAWLVIEKIGCVDDVTYTPNEAQEIISGWIDRAKRADEVAALASSPAQVEAKDAPGETYYAKGKDAEWVETLSDKDLAWALTCAAQDINDSDDNVSTWMPVSAFLSVAADRIAALRRHKAVLDGWRPIETAPKDGTTIIGWCVHDVEPYHDEKTGNLTDYGCHVEALGRVQDGPHILVWGGADSDYDEWSGKTLSWPDWWFRFGSEFEEAANPVAWMPLPTAPTPAPAEGR